jgi:ribosomal protein L31E
VREKRRWAALTTGTVGRATPAQVKQFAMKEMKTDDVRIDVKLNKHIWSKGIRNVSPPSSNAPCLCAVRQCELSESAELTGGCALAQVPKRIRVKISRKANEDEDAKVRLYSRAPPLPPARPTTTVPGCVWCVWSCSGLTYSSLSAPLYADGLMRTLAGRDVLLRDGGGLPQGLLRHGHQGG